MVKAGDGARRSDSRRLGTMISLRLSPDEKLRFEALAKAGGYPSLAAWILDRLRDNTGIGLHHRRLLVGLLGRLGADIASHAREAPEDARGLLLRLSSRIASLQRGIMERYGDAGEDDR